MPKVSPMPYGIAVQTIMSKLCLRRTARREECIDQPDRAQIADEVRKAAGIARAAALGGLTARAEAVEAGRAAARKAAFDWLRGGCVCL